MKYSWNKLLPITCIASICVMLIIWLLCEKVHERKMEDEMRSTFLRAQGGDMAAQTNLGRMYYYGLSLPQNYDEASKWFRKAADQGDARAQYGLGTIYFYGQGIPRDYFEALRWFRKAAEQGDAKGEYNLALMYYHGFGVQQNYFEAAGWYRQAADQGLAKAEYDLGYLYYYGQGVTQDRIEADRWFQKAADQGNEDARHILGEGLTTSRIFILMGQLIAGILLTAGLLIPRKVSWSIQTKMTTIAGVLCFLCASLNWYGYTHYETRCLLCGFNTFSLIKGLLNGVLLVLLIYILLSAKRRRVSHS